MPKLKRMVAEQSGENPSVGTFRNGTFDAEIHGANTGQRTARPVRITAAGVAGMPRGNVKGRFNLKAVVEVLQEAGLDPTVEIAKILQQAGSPMVDDNGVPIRDSDGQAVRHPALGLDVKVKTLLELQQFVHPKLKAIEVTHKPPELTDEQINERLVALLSQASKGTK